MKSLKDVLLEQIEEMNETASYVLEADDKDAENTDKDTDGKDEEDEKDTPSTKTVISLSFDGIDGGAETVSSIKSICSADNVPFDTANMNVGIKITVTEDKKETLEKIAELVQTFISGIPTEKHEDISKELDKLVGQLDKLNDLLDDYNGEEE